ncbi:hypothetical protein C8R45DRAFT_940048 [Mycena sanguinolenta]|nr:hypothetical protein C8R45DRAFT_940048 [Mycena sanguinolenta]
MQLEPLLGICTTWLRLTWALALDLPFCRHTLDFVHRRGLQSSLEILDPNRLLEKRRAYVLALVEFRTLSQHRAFEWDGRRIQMQNTYDLIQSESRRVSNFDSRLLPQMHWQKLYRGKDHRQRLKSP